MTHLPPVRIALVVLGCLLMAAAPIVGPIPGPGGIIVFAAGLSLVLKYSGWAKRLYVRLKRRHPKKGAWADWGLRRASARRRRQHRAAPEMVEQGDEIRRRQRLDVARPGRFRPLKLIQIKAYARLDNPAGIPVP